MGNYRSRRPGFLEGWQVNVAEMMFRGYTDMQIIEEIWPEKTEKKQKENARRRLRKLREDEKFQEYYRTLIKEWSIHHVGEALIELASQMHDKNGWLRNKACNDILMQSKQFIGNDENTVVVKVEGMPELGIPDEE